MDGALRLSLPIRLVPRKRVQGVLLVFFGFFFVFSVIWIVGALQPGVRLEFNEQEVTDPAMRQLFPLFGVPFFLIGAGGLFVCLLRVLPHSPYYHIEVTADGLRLRTLTQRSAFAWRDLPAFETLEVVKRDDDGTTRTYYAIAMRPEAPTAPGAPAKSTIDPREIVRVPAGEYGVKDTQEDAQMLADWLNHVRDQALLRRSDGIEISEALRKIAIGLSAPSQTQRQQQTVIRR